MKLAERYAPALRANSAQIEGAENIVSASGILPNPKLFVGLDNYPVSGDAAWSVTQEGMTMQKIGIMQDFPNRAKRLAEVELAKKLNWVQQMLKQKFCKLSYVKK